VKVAVVDDRQPSRPPRCFRSEPRKDWDGLLHLLAKLSEKLGPTVIE
jgi:hypothetical protein